MFASTYWLILILHGGASPAMVTMPQTYNKTNCEASGKAWVESAGQQYRREYFCIKNAYGENQ